jgi:hypothetical protein
MRPVEVSVTVPLPWSVNREPGREADTESTNKNPIPNNTTELFMAYPKIFMLTPYQVHS